MATDKPPLKKKLFPMLNEVPRKAIQKEKKKTFKYVFNKIRLKKCASATISKPFPTYNVAYLGNVITGWAKGEGCIEKPLATLWRNYIQSSRPDVSMQLTVSGGGLKAVTKNHGLTEYWAHRLTTCAAPAEFPRIFCWVYRHEGRRLRHELRCHAVLCVSSEVAAQIDRELKDFLSRALNDFKKEKLSRQNARLSLVNCINENATMPRRKILLAVGYQNYRPPLESSKSAPKLSSIEEIFGEEEDDLFGCSTKLYKDILKSYQWTNHLLERSKYYDRRKPVTSWNRMSPQDCSAGQDAEPQKRVSFEHQDTLLNAPAESDELIQDKPESDQKSEMVEFKIGGEVHPFVNPIINKGIMEQEQVSLVPVGEPLTDFSSLKVYKKKTFGDGAKDFSACAMFLSGETVSQLEHIFQTHCSFGGDRGEEDITTGKLNNTLTV